MDMIMKRKVNIFGAFLLSLPILTGCTYNPFTTQNHITGSPAAAAAGAGIGAGTMALVGGSKLAIGIAGIAGGTAGYYVTTLRYASGGVLQAGGKVYKIGDYLGIYIPTDNVFEANTADFLPQAKPILDSAVNIIKRYPNHSVLISGSTSGFYRARWEQSLSELRAQKVSAYLWNAGINQSNPYLHINKLTYVGHGDYFPLAKNLTNKGIRENSRIQITSYPVDGDLLFERKVPSYEMTDPKVLAAVTSPPPVTVQNNFIPITPPPVTCETMDSEGRCLDELIGQG
jgi:outer membrane protein OmpA-like peptidoglycan-associated protein